MRRAAAVALCVIVYGCTSAPSAEWEAPAVAADRSAMVFVLPDWPLGPVKHAGILFAYAQLPSLYDVTSGRPEFIGTLARGSRIVHMVTPGEHVFMVVIHSTAVGCGLDCPRFATGPPRFMPAVTLPGKAYYAVARGRGRQDPFELPWFELLPVRHRPENFVAVRGHDEQIYALSGDPAYYLDASRLSRLLGGLETAAKDPAAERWSAENRREIVDAHKTHWPRWQAEPARKRAAVTLNPEDGR